MDSMSMKKEGKAMSPEEIMQSGLSPNERKALSALGKALRRRYGIIDFRLFGSKARGEAGSDSDIDVMIEVDGLTPELEREIDELVFGINLRFDCFISALLFSRSELEEGPMDESPVYKRIVREGIQL